MAAKVSFGGGKFELKIIYKLHFKVKILTLLLLIYYKTNNILLSGNNWENCVVELEQTGTPGEVDFGTLSVFGTKKHKVILN